jgi:protein TonB
MLSLSLGAGFTVLIFLGIARFDLTEPMEPPADIMDLRAISLQEPPPPPRDMPQEAVPVEAILTGFDPGPSESPVQIAVTPPDLEALLPPPPMAPPAVIQAGRLYVDLKPKMDLTAPGDHIFQMAEVDQVPQVLNRVSPTIPTSVRQGAATLRASLVFVVDASGEIRNVRLASSSGNSDFDAIILGNIKEWTFSPAVRKGKKVRCLLQQAVIIKWSGGSRFEI